MHRDVLLWIGISVLTCAVLTMFAPLAQAGPPLVCHPYDIGNAQSLPWGGGPGWRTPAKEYDVKRLVDDTLALLGPSTPVIVRMETLRRAAIYAANDPTVGKELFLKLEARARAGKPDTLTLFDVGYLVESYKQMGWTSSIARAVSGVDGSEMIRRAIHLRGGDAEMEFAAALASAGQVFKGESNEHLRRAVAGAQEGSLLAQNLVSHGPVFGRNAANFAELRGQVLAQQK